MSDITASQLATFYPQQGDGLRGLLARFVRSRLPSSPVTILGSAARTVTTATPVIDIGGQDLAVFLDCTAAAGPSGIQIYLRGADQNGADLNVFHPGHTILTSAGRVGLVFRNGQMVGRNSTGGAILTQACPLPQKVTFIVIHSGADAYTYSVSYQLMGIK